jgi:hypothetical protein
MRSIVWVAAAAAIVLAGSGGSFAQSMGQGMGTPTANPGAKSTAAAPRKQRYYYRGRDARAKTCGQFKYWSGKRCMDARTSPPKLK